MQRVNIESLPRPLATSWRVVNAAHLECVDDGCGTVLCNLYQRDDGHWHGESDGVVTAPDTSIILAAEDLVGRCFFTSPSTWDEHKNEFNRIANEIDLHHRAIIEMIDALRSRAGQAADQLRSLEGFENWGTRVPVMNEFLDTVIRAVCLCTAMRETLTPLPEALQQSATSAVVNFLNFKMSEAEQLNSMTNGDESDSHKALRLKLEEVWENAERQRECRQHLYPRSMVDGVQQLMHVDVRSGAPGRSFL